MRVSSIEGGMQTHRFLCWLLWLCAGCAKPADEVSPLTARAGDLVFADVTVVPMSSDGVLAHRTVVVRDDRIVEVAPAATGALPPGVRVIDGKGKWLLPGLADMHVHTWRDDDLTMFVAAGVTTIRNMWGIEQHLRWRDEIKRGVRLGPTIVTAGALIDGDPPDWPGSTVLTNPGDADRIVADQQAAGYDFLKSVSQLTPAAYAALVAAAARHHMLLAGHVPNAVGIEGALAARQRSVEHLDGYLAALVPPTVKLPAFDDGEVRDRAVLAALDPSRLPPLIAATIAAGTWNCPTLIALQRLTELTDLPALRSRVHWLDKVPAALQAQWTPPPSFTAADFATVRQLTTENARVLAALVAANAPILVGTDTGVSFVVPGEGLHDEIEAMVAAGVPRARVMRAATADAWRYLGSPHEAGVVEVGARADLILASSNPLTEPLPLVPDAVVVRGRLLLRGELDALLAQVAAREAAPKDRWSGVPPLAAHGGTPARYTTTIGTTPVGGERLVTRGSSLVGQIINDAERMVASYDVGPDTAHVSATYHGVTLALSGKIVAGALEVHGMDLGGGRVSSTTPVPAGAFLAAPGLGGTIQLIASVANLKVAARRKLVAVQLAYFPAVAVVSTSYELERKPDRDGHRVFAVIATPGGAAEVMVDERGVVAQTVGEVATSRTDP